MDIYMAAKAVVSHSRPFHDFEFTVRVLTFLFGTLKRSWLQPYKIKRAKIPVYVHLPIKKSLATKVARDFS